MNPVAVLSIVVRSSPLDNVKERRGPLWHYPRQATSYGVSTTAFAYFCTTVPYLNLRKYIWAGPWSLDLACRADSLVICTSHSIGKLRSWCSM